MHGGAMSIVKVIELIAESNQGWEQAAQEAVTSAAKTVRNIKTAYVKDMQAIVENNKIVRYRVNVQITFLVED
jgi:flavin-binding protein dodecin